MNINKSNNFSSLIDQKRKYEVVRLYEYLNLIEDEIVRLITSKHLIHHYNLASTIPNRCVCPFHTGARNNTSLILNDNKRTFNCYSCGESGSYIKFIALIGGYSHNPYNEAKIYAANNFACMTLGFDSVADYKSQLDALILDRYNQTKSFDLKDYYDISLINQTFSVKTDKKQKDCYVYIDTSNILNDENGYELAYYDIDKSIKEYKEKKEDYLYLEAMDIAHKSKLISDIESSKDINTKKEMYEYMMNKYFIPRVDCNRFDLVVLKKSVQSKLFQQNLHVLNDRLLFPYQDHETGKIVGYQARTITNVLSQPKYLNVSDYGHRIEGMGITRFSIGEFLFNLYRIKDKQVDNLFLTEGAADTIKLDSLGYTSLSTGQANITEHQIFLLYRYFGLDVNIYLFFDNDKNGIGQNKSISNAYKMHQYGFRNIYIMRTYHELGSDITDVATKIQDDKKLMLLVDIWIKEARNFVPASNKDIDTLWNSGLFSENELITIDPSKIKEIVENVVYIKNKIDLTLIDKEFKKKIKKIIFLDKGQVELLVNSYNKITTEKKSVLIDNKTINSRYINTNINYHTNIYEENTNTNDIYNWKPTNLSREQLYYLKKHYDIETIETIDYQCNKKQICSIIGKLKKDVKFDINNYFKTKD